MSDEKKIKLYIAAIVAVVILTIGTILFLWIGFFNRVSTSSKKDDIVVEVGVFSYREYGTNDIAEKYINEVRNMIQNIELEKIFNEYLSEDFKQRSNYDYDSFKESLQKRGLLGKSLTYSGVTSSSFNNKRVFSTMIQTVDKTSSIQMNIIEESPNNYKITFNDFLFEDNKKAEQIVNGVKMTINSKKFYTGRIEIDSTIENLNTTSVFINCGLAPEAAAFEDYNESRYTTMSTVLGTQKYELAPNATINYPYVYNTSMEIYSGFKSLVLKDVKVGEYAVMGDIEYRLF